ncbi:MAG: hypothetical protein F4187_07105 [Gemmatimonadetes bacterium]|nr:hypothetical protein [Gemmatimonadota bacterium]MYI07050.1 hypothetical protein [Gemmatimonadota bacterium]
MKNTMKDKRLWILLAILGNLALVPMVLTVQAGSAQQRSNAVMFHCCKTTSTGQPYCCSRCCVFRWNCNSHEVCVKRAQR